MLPDRIITHSEWNAAPPDPRRPLQSDRLPVKRVWLHHTAGSQRATPNDIQHLHQTINGWRFLAYSWLIDQHGTVYEGTGLKRHLNSDAGHSSTFLFIGNYDIHHVPPPMIDAAAWLLAHGVLAGWWEATLDGEPHITGGHRDVPGAATACPGKFGHVVISIVNVKAVQIVRSLTAPQEVPDMFIAVRTSDDHRELTNGITRRPFRDWAEMVKYRDAGVRELPLEPAEFDMLAERD